MIVRELIEQLSQIENKELDVTIWDSNNGDLVGVAVSIDDTLTDRVDIIFK